MMANDNFVIPSISKDTKDKDAPIAKEMADMLNKVIDAVHPKMAPVSDTLAQWVAKMNVKSLEPLKKVILSQLTLLRDKEDWIQRHPKLKVIENTIQLPPLASAAVLSTIGYIALVRWWKHQANWITNAIGVLYPAYCSLCAIENPRTDDDERWLTYWSFFGAFSLIDSSLSSRVPYYFGLKASFLYWLFGRNGALIMYRRVLRRYLPLDPPKLEDDSQTL